MKKYNLTVLFALFLFSAKAQTYNDKVTIKQDQFGYPGLDIKSYQGVIEGHPAINMYNYGGSSTSKSPTPGGKIIGALIYSGYSGTQDVQAGRISVESEADFSVGNYPTKMHFQLGGTGPCCGLKRMTIDGQTGNIGIGTLTPFQKLSLLDGQLFLGHSEINQIESGRIRFSEYQNTFQGAFIHYNGNTNIFNIGVHEISGTNLANDHNAISIRRNNGNVGIGNTNPSSLLHIKKGNSGAPVHEFSVLNVEHSSDAMVAILTPANKTGYFGFAAPGDDYVAGMQYEHVNHRLVFRSNNNTQDLTINGDGNVGIGTLNPFQKLSILNGQLFLGHSETNQIESGRIRFSEYQNSFQGAFIHYNGNTNIFNIGVHEISGTELANDHNALSIKRNNGNVGIGTDDPGAWKLAVNGKIRAKEIKVETNWSDFVFEENYNLPSLREVEEHIAEKGHLRDIPSAKDVKENGIQLGEMDSKLLQKIEELTLYLIEQNKKLESQNEMILELQKEVVSLKD